MAIINLSLTIDDPDILSDIQSIFENYEGATIEEKIKDFLKKKIKVEINKKREKEYNESFSDSVDDIEQS